MLQVYVHHENNAANESLFTVLLIIYSHESEGEKANHADLM